MTRARGGGVTRRRHKKIIKMAKGHRGLSHKIFKQANQSVMHALRYAYQHRRDRKGDFRRLWIQRINAASRQHGLTFPILIEGEGWPVSQQYDPDATPTLYLIEPDGVISMTSVGFHKQELNEISRRIAERLGEPPQVIAEEDDGNQPFKPG